MRRLPPRSTRTATLFPCTTLFRSFTATISRVPAATKLRSPWAIRVRAASWPSVHVSRSEEHTSELQSLMRISYAVFCLKKKKNHLVTNNTLYHRRINHTIHKLRTDESTTKSIDHTTQ